jgi:hypothetical protein
MITRRRLLQLGGAAALSLPFVRTRAHNSPARAKRLVIFYFPDGIVGASQSGQPSLWTPSGGETTFTLPDLLQPLVPYRQQCVFFRGLSMGPADSGSHPGGAKKLLTAADNGNHISIDQRLASTVGADDPFRLLYLGAHANSNNASGDKHISYVAPGFTTPPDDDPVGAFARVFGSSGTTGGGGGGGDGRASRRLSVLDNARGELDALREKLGETEKTKLELHVEAVREVEKRIQALTDGGGGGASCTQPAIDATGIDASTLYAPDRFPQVLRAQIDLMVQAMACGMTRVGVIQASHHTSELIMSRFANTQMFDPTFDMRSHQASHYGASHDPAHREYRAFAQQVKWWVEQFAYLLAQLAARPEGQGTMLDESLVLLCSEIADGNTHLHDDMPFVLAGGGGGTIRTGRFLDVGYRRHGDLLVALANAMGDGLTSFGDASSGPLPGLLT